MAQLAFPSLPSPLPPPGDQYTFFFLSRRPADWIERVGHDMEGHCQPANLPGRGENADAGRAVGVDQCRGVAHDCHRDENSRLR